MSVCLHGQELPVPKPRCSCPLSKTFQSAGDIPRCSLHPCDVFTHHILTDRAVLESLEGSGRVGLHSQAPVELWFHGSAGHSWHRPSTKWFVYAGLFFLRAQLVCPLLIVLPQPTLGLSSEPSELPLALPTEASRNSATALGGFW